MSAPTPRPRALPGLVVTLAALCAMPEGAGAQRVANPADVRGAVDAVFAAYDRTDSPGCALGVIHDGALVYARGYGMANLDLGVALGPTSVFRIGSTSKQFTAAAMVLAEQEGALSLDDDIRTYLPELPDYASSITIRMLLHHTSGIRDYLTLAYLAGLRDDDWYTDEEALDLIARQHTTNFPPGTEHLYSNSGYFLLSQIIRRATGSSLRAYAEAHIFRPLGMTHTHFHDDHTEIVPNRASGYARDGGGFRISMTTLDMVGDGGVFTSIEDLVAWDRNFYEPRVGGPAFVEAMLSRGVLADGDTLDYALGLSHGVYRGLPVVEHGGAFVGFRAQLMRFPGQRFSVACLCNLASTNPTALAHAVADAFLADFMTPVEGAVAGGRSVAGAPASPATEAAPATVLTPERARAYAGRYHSDELGVDYVVEAAGAELSVRRGRGQVIPLTPTVERAFTLDGDAVVFDPFGGGQPAAFTIDAGRVRGIRFVRVGAGGG